MNYLNKYIVILLTACTGPVTQAFADVAAKYSPQKGGTAGTGELHEVELTWSTTAPIVKTMNAGFIRTNNFSGETISYEFETTVVINKIELKSVNAASKSKITMYDAEGKKVDLDQITVSTPDGGIDGFPSSLDDNSIQFVADRGDISNYAVDINFLTPVYYVKKIIFEVEAEQGLLDIRIRGSRL